MRLDQNKISIALISIGTVLIITAVVLMSLVATDIIGGGNGGNSSLETVAGFGDPIKTPTPGPSPTPTGRFPPGSDAPVTRLIIKRVGIDAPVVEKGIDANGAMQTPDNAFDTVWYDFSAHPGFAGNAVFAGHVDYVHVGKAVFWNLKDVEPGDLVQVRLQDGTVYTYSVNFRQQYDAATAPVDQIVGPTPDETVTLITCSGTFNSGTHQYDKRLVVRAVRVAENAPPIASQPPA